MKFSSSMLLDMHIGNAQTGPIHAPKTANINDKNWTVHNILYGRRQQSRRTKTANITKDDITSQHSDISATCCDVISSFLMHRPRSLAYLYLRTLWRYITILFNFNYKAKAMPFCRRIAWRSRTWSRGFQHCIQFSFIY